MAGSSTSSVIIAVTANALVTIAKFIGWGFTGSAALFSEAIHSVADTANQALLLIGLKKSLRPADDVHPFGYGRERFFWGLVSALGIFFVGAGVTLMHGIEGLIDPHHVEHGTVTWVVLAIAFALEGWALFAAVKGVAHDAKKAGMTFSRYVKEGKDPTILAVLLEDSAAVFGVIIAAVCILMTQLTHDPIWDAVASILIGLLLAFVALFLVAKNRSYLLTKSIDHEIEERLREVIEGHGSVESISAFKGTVASLGQYRIAADIDFDGREVAKRVVTPDDVAALRAVVADDEALQAWLGDFSERLIEQVGDEIDEIEDKVRAVVPEAAHVDLEQD